MANKDINKILQSKTEEEKKAIREKASKTKKKNAAKKFRIRKAVLYALDQKVKNPEGTNLLTTSEMIAANLINEAITPGGKNVVAAVKEIRSIIGEDVPEEDKNSTTINVVFGENKGIDI